MIRSFLAEVLGVSALAWLGIVAASADDFQRVDFAQLGALDYEPRLPEKGKDKVVRKDRAYLERFVTPEVMALNGKPVEVAGYMLPLTLMGDKVDEFLLMPDTGSCCFGAMPAYNGFVYAKAKKGANLLDNVPIRIRGKLTVEEVWQKGFFSHLYYIEVEELEIGFGATAPNTQISL